MDEIHYPVGVGFIGNRIIARGLSPDDEFTASVAESVPFRGAVADCLLSLITAPNFSEADKSISLSDKELILKRANAIYSSIGEDEAVVDEPVVYVGDCLK